MFFFHFLTITVNEEKNNRLKIRFYTKTLMLEFNYLLIVTENLFFVDVYNSQFDWLCYEQIYEKK